MFRTAVALDIEWLNTLQQVHAIIPDHIEAYAKRDLRPSVSQRVDTTLRVEPPVRSWPDDYPIEWTSEKQRRYVMAFVLERDANGNIIPYERTHEYVHGWHVQGNYAHGLTAIEVFHDSDVADFIGGRRQQRFHRITGWANAPDTLQVLSIDLNDRIEVGLPLVIDEAFEELGW